VQTDLILYALVAAGLVFWLRSVLGTRSGDERERPNPFATPVRDKSTSSPDAPSFDEKDGLPIIAVKPVLPRNVSIVSETVEADLADFARRESGFDVGHFAQGAQDAFALIVESFAAGDRQTLKNLLEPQVYGAFDAALKQREQSGETMSAEIHAVRKVEILECRADSKTAYITARFIADETCVERDRENKILSGDPDRITEMNDIWVFSRPLRSRDPKWLVHETRDGDVHEDDKLRVPDTA